MSKLSEVAARPEEGTVAPTAKRERHPLQVVEVEAVRIPMEQKDPSKVEFDDSGEPMPIFVKVGDRLIYEDGTEVTVCKRGLGKRRRYLKGLAALVADGKMTAAEGVRLAKEAPKVETTYSVKGKFIKAGAMSLGQFKRDFPGLNHTPK